MGLSLGGITNTLFGGSNQNTSSQQSIYGPQNTFMSGSYYPGLTDLYNQYSQNPQSLVAGFTPTQQAGQQMGINYATGMMPSLINNAQGLQSQLANTGQGFQNFGQSLSPYAGQTLANNMQAPSGQYGDALNQMMSGQLNLDPYNKMAGSIADQMSQNFNQNIVPNIRRNSLAASGVPTSRMGNLTAQAGSQFSKDLGSTLNSLYMPAYQQAQQNMGTGAGLYGNALQNNINAANIASGLYGQGVGLNSNALSNAMGFSPQLAQMGYAPSQALQDIGATQQQQNQSFLQSPFSFMQNIQSLMGQPTALTSSQGNSITTPNIFHTLFPGGLSSSGTVMA